MANEIIKKFKMPVNQLPPVSPENTYSVRYRVISEDKNRTSHWSPIFNINGTPVALVSGTLYQNGDSINIVWDDEQNRPEYDIFVKFDGGSYFYHGTSPIHTYSFLKKTYTSVRVLVQIAGSVKEVVPALKIFESDTLSLV
jgi:hypothetical protein